MRLSQCIVIGACLVLPTLGAAKTTTQRHKTRPVHRVVRAAPVVTVAAPAAAPAPQNREIILPVKLTAYIDGSYNYLSRSHFFSSGVNDRVFDLDQNGFTLQQIGLTLSDQPAEGLGFLANGIFGRDANSTFAYGMSSVTDSENFGIDLVQLYAQYAMSSFTVIGGKYTTLAGAEAINPTLDSNFSRSILFGYAQPYTHTGIRSTYIYDCHWTFNLGVNDGWDTIRDWGRRKTLEGNVTFTLNPMFTLGITDYNGEQRATDRVSSGPSGTRNLLDLLATINATDQLTLILNYDWGTQSRADLPNGNLSRATWQGIAGYANYQFNDMWRVSGRGEWFNDENGFRTGVKQQWSEATLTFGLKPLCDKHFEIRAEGRYDISNTDAFFKRNRVNTSNNNASVGLEAYYAIG